MLYAKKTPIQQMHYIELKLSSKGKCCQGSHIKKCTKT